jgi:NAD+ synthase (glutamine-hydrolysing)
MRVGLAQIDTRVGDFAGNAARIVAATESAARAGADLVVFPELVVTGYPPRDLLLDPAFVDAAAAATEDLAARLGDGPAVVVGTVARSGATTPGHPGLWNVAAVLDGGRVAATVAKQLLPVYDVFLEPRWFVPAAPSDPVVVRGTPVGLLVCEDLWDEGYAVRPPEGLVARGAELLVCIAASPFRAGVYPRRFGLAGRHGVPLVFVNHVGATDELIFDGGSFVADAAGRPVATLARFEEEVDVVDVDGARPVDVAPEPEAEELFRALALGVRDFCLKNGLRRAVVGLSGGIDSALVACVAREALGAAAVTAVALPSRYTDARSTASARDLAEALGIGFEVVEIEPMHAAAEASLGGLLEGPEGAVAAENVQARLRALALMAFVNRRGGVLLNTSNKTELALGYGTLYGDMAGTLAVVGDLTKPQVYDVARWYDAGRGRIPRFVLERAPSAELRPDQVDPFDYPREAPIVEALVRDEPVEGADRYRRLLHAAEHKRWQSGIVLKVSERAFGSGRLVPVTRA